MDARCMTITLYLFQIHQIKGFDYGKFYPYAESQFPFLYYALHEKKYILLSALQQSTC